MLLHAAIVPPAPVLAEAVEVLRGALGTGAGQATEPGGRRRGLLGRRRTSSADASGGPAPAGPTGLDLFDPALVLLPLTSFGNLTPRDAARLAAGIAEGLAGLTPPVVRLAGGEALEPIGDDRVGVCVAEPPGREGALRAVAPSVVAAVEKVGIFCDRRVFRPVVHLARVNDHTTEAHLEAVLAALGGFAGTEWTVGHVSVLQRPADPRREPSRELERVPIG